MAAVEGKCTFASDSRLKTRYKVGLTNPGKDKSSYVDKLHHSQVT